MRTIFHSPAKFSFLIFSCCYLIQKFHNFFRGILLLFSLSKDQPQLIKCGHFYAMHFFFCHFLRHLHPSFLLSLAKPCPFDSYNYSPYLFSTKTLALSFHSYSFKIDGSISLCSNVKYSSKNNRSAISSGFSPHSSLVSAK